jgi:hypothetical protein
LVLEDDDNRSTRERAREVAMDEWTV